jgi:tetratricopeptide (TPR) repeat protein
VDERVERARQRYEQAVIGGDPGPLDEADLELDAAEADLALARGRIRHARFLQQRDADPGGVTEPPGELALFERAAQLYQQLGSGRGEAESVFWIGCFHQVVRRDNATAVPALHHSLALATAAGDKATMSEALRHLGIAAHAAGQLDAARARLEESTRLRREIGLVPGVAANLVGLAYIAAGEGRRDDALAALAEAAGLAEASGARRILNSVTEASAELAGRPS